MIFLLGVSLVIGADTLTLADGVWHPVVVLAPRFEWTAPDPLLRRAGGGSFGLDRARLGAVGGLGDPTALRLGGRIETELGQTGSDDQAIGLRDGWVELGYSPRVGLRLGLQEVPVSRARRAADNGAMLPDPPRIVGALPDRELGASLKGVLGNHVLDYAGGVYGGAGLTPSDDGTFLFAGSLVWSPLGAPDPSEELVVPGTASGFSVGWSALYEIEGVPGERSATWANVLEGGAHWGYLSVSGEGLWGMTDRENPAVTDSVSWGWYTQASGNLGFVPVARRALRHVFVLGRLQVFDPYIPLAILPPLTDPLDPTQSTLSYALGLGAALGPPFERGGGSARASVTWNRRRELEGLSYRNDGLVVSTQLSF